MPTPVGCALGILLAALLAAPARAGRGGAGAPHTLLVVSRVAGLVPADTTRRPVATDTTRRPALVPDTTAVPAAEDKPTRKTTLLTALAIAVLTISTLLLYNVRSR